MQSLEKPIAATSLAGLQTLWFDIVADFLYSLFDLVELSERVLAMHA
jgi:hypothetical protein